MRAAALSKCRHMASADVLDRAPVNAVGTLLKNSAGAGRFWCIWLSFVTVFAHNCRSRMFVSGDHAGCTQWRTRNGGHAMADTQWLVM